MVKNTDFGVRDCLGLSSGSAVYLLGVCASERERETLSKFLNNFMTQLTHL